MCQMSSVACTLLVLTAGPLIAKGQPHPNCAKSARMPAKEEAEQKAKDGLHCVLTADRDTVPMGDAVIFALRLHFDPVGADAKVNLLNTSRENWNAVFVFTDAATGQTFRRSPYQTGMPPSPTRPDDIVALRGGALPSHELKVYLLSPQGEQIPPGTYRVTAAYENAAKEQVDFVKQPDGEMVQRPYQGPWRFWKGKLTSGPFLLKVTPLEPKEVVLKIHSSLEIVRERQTTADGQPINAIGYTWSKKDPKEVSVQQRPGYFLGRRYEFRVFVSGRLVPNVGGGGVSGAIWEEGGSRHFPPQEVVNRVHAGESLKVYADVQAFETSMPPGHLWAPEAGDFKVLWRGRIESKEQQTRWGETARGLRARIAAQPGNYRPGEPIPVTVILENLGTPDLPDGRAQLFPHLDLWVRRAGKAQEEYIAAKLDIENRLIIPKGEQFVQTLDLTRLAALGMPGEHSIAGGHDNFLVSDSGDWVGRVRSPFLGRIVVLAEPSRSGAEKAENGVAKPRTAMDWVTLARYGDLETRRRAARALGGVRPEDRNWDAAIAALLEALRDLATRYAATDAFVEIGAPAVPPLIEKALENDRKGITGQEHPYALQALGAIGKEAIPALTKAMLLRGEERAREAERHLQALHVPKTPIPASTLVAREAAGEPAWWRTRPSFAETLAFIGQPAVKPMEELLEKGSNLDRRQAAHVLGLMGPEAKEAIPALVKAMRGGDAALAALAAYAIRWISPSGHPSLLPPFRQALQDSDPGLQLTAAAVLIAWGQGDEAVVETCLRLLRDDPGVVAPAPSTVVPLRDDPGIVAPAQLTGVPRVQHSRSPIRLHAGVAAQLLGKIKPHSPRIVSALIEARAAKSLAQIGPDAAAAIPVLLPEYPEEAAALGPKAVVPLTALLEHKYASTRQKAARALGSMGSAAKEAVPALLAALQRQKDGFMRPDIIRALGQMGPAAEAAMPVLVEMLKDPSQGQCWGAVWVLGQIGPSAKPSVPHLVRLMKEDDRYANFHKWDTAEAIWRIDPSHPALMPMLLAGLKSVDPGQIAEAAQLLGKMGPKAKEALPTLVAARSGERDHAFDALTLAIARIDPSHPAGVPSLVADLEHPIEFYRRDAAGALEVIGPPAKSAAPALVQALHDPAWNVRRAAARALCRIDLNAAEQAGVAMVGQDYTLP